MCEPRVIAQGASQWVPRPAFAERGDPSREAPSRQDWQHLLSSGSMHHLMSGTGFAGRH